jgi:flagellar assembly factor FliW
MRPVRAFERITDPKRKIGNAVIHFDEGLIGFSDCKDFAVVESATLNPFRLLQSTDCTGVNFLVLEPTVFISDYYSHIPEREWESLGISGSTKPLALVIVAIGSTPEMSTGNLRAPLLVNYDQMIGKQLILTDSDLPLRHPVI